MTDRYAVVTGVSSGLGDAIAANLLARGFDVVGVGRGSAARLASPSFRLVVTDLADLAQLPAKLDDLFGELASRRVSSIAVINNAATAQPAGTVGGLDAGAVAAALAVNLVAPLIVANAFVRAFRTVDTDRRLVNVSSGAAVRPIPGSGTYNVAKAGLEMLTSVIAAEQSGVTAITIRPGIIDTPMQAFLRAQSDERLPAVGMFRGFHESHRLVPPDVTAAKIVERLVIGPIENGRTYVYDEL
jgi:NAD(P)-dependent dehydrogenase (short-subunit alcohol dehydrogenase family)